LFMRGYGGELGIRTLGELPHTAFRGVILPIFRPFLFICSNIFTDKTLISRGFLKVALYVFISFCFVIRDSFITILQHDNILIYGGQLKRRLL